MAITEKQQQVLGLLNSGMDPKEIAAQLGVSKAAIYSHMRSIKADGIALPERYANVGKGRGRGRGRGTSTRRASQAAPRGLPTDGATRLPATPPPVVVPPVNADTVFSALDAHFEQEQARILARLTELGDEHTRLYDALQANEAEKEGLSEASARLSALRKAAKDPSTLTIEPEGDAAKDNGDGATKPPPKGKRVAATV
jgi:AcrR family transcriptional regulator